MNSPLRGTAGIAAITGGAGALGSTLARTLVSAGYKVALLDMERSRDRLASLVTELGKDVAFGHVGDFASRKAWDGTLQAIAGGLGGVPTHAALVAGGWDGGAPLHEAKDDSYTKMMSANAETVFHALHALLGGMVAAKHGSIVVIGSRAVERPWTSSGAAAYAASKSAAVTLAQAAAAEVLASGVRINAILPSTMDTAANRSAMPLVDPSTWVSLESAAGVIAFLLSDAARDVSGAAIPVYGRA
jgi:NAD(P)-dependent dehydrogenase (short-subunit alcohol dehydrogenase family)